MLITNNLRFIKGLSPANCHMVYGAALSQVNGHAHLAQGLAQTVFANLAAKAATLQGARSIAGGSTTAPGLRPSNQSARKPAGGRASSPSFP
jgi:hypothetical protein